VRPGTGGAERIRLLDIIPTFEDETSAGQLDRRVLLGPEGPASRMSVKVLFVGKNKELLHRVSWEIMIFAIFAA